MFCVKRIVAISALGAGAIGCQPFPATYTSQPTEVHSVTTYRPSDTGVPHGVVPAGSGAFYYDEGNAASADGRGVVAGLASSNGSLHEYLIKTDNQFESVASATDGTLWATSTLDGSAGLPVLDSGIELLTATRSMIAFRIPPRFGSAKKLLFGPDGSLWFALPDAHGVGRLTRQMKFSMAVTFKSLEPTDIAFDKNGLLYVAFATSIAAGGDIARISHDRSIVMLRTFSPVDAIAGSADGVWFTENSSNRIGHITRTGRVEQFSPGRGVRVLEAIVVGKDSVWFAAHDGIGRLSLITHAITLVPLPDRDSIPNALAVSQTGDVWLTEEIRDPRCFSECGGVARIVP